MTRIDTCWTIHAEINTNQTDKESNVLNVRRLCMRNIFDVLIDTNDRDLFCNTAHNGAIWRDKIRINIENKHRAFIQIKLHLKCTLSVVIKDVFLYCTSIKALLYHDVV